MAGASNGFVGEVRFAVQTSPELSARPDVKNSSSRSAVRVGFWFAYDVSSSVNWRGVPNKLVGRGPPPSSPVLPPAPHSTQHAASIRLESLTRRRYDVIGGAGKSVEHEDQTDASCRGARQRSWSI